MEKACKVAVLGYGTVGQGVCQVLDENSAVIERHAARPLELKYILDVVDIKGPYAPFHVRDFSVIENDPEVAVVAECIGGATYAYDFTKRALLAGKSVVTSNKELVSTHGFELISLARERNLNYLFEASVGGGIPILEPLTQCLGANEISQIYGILNGTTNYILTKMISEGIPFTTALKQAQEKGYAEANPAADVDGHDACRKICILAALAFGRHVYPDTVPCEGIRSVSLSDARFAESGGYKIKLIGHTLRLADGRVCTYVAPCLVPLSNLISGIDDVFNGIAVCGNAVGSVIFSGPGAGKMPTASAVVSDMIDCSKHIARRKSIQWDDADPSLAAAADELSFRWYIRCSDPAASQLFSAVKTLSNSTAQGEYGFITSPMRKSELLSQLGSVQPLSLLRILE